MLKKTIALILSLALALGSALALAEAVPAVTPAAADAVLATLNNQPVYKSEADGIMPALADYMSDATDYRYAVNFIIQQRVLDKKIKDMGFDVFTAEEESAFAVEAQAQWDEGVESYVSYYLAEDTQEARDAMRLQAEDFFAQQGFSLETLAQDIRQRAAIDRMSEYLVGSYAPTDAEIDSVFQQYGAQYQQSYENDIMGYEYNTIFNQQPSWYTPEGYRGIIHILLTPDEALLEEYNRLQSAFEEQQSALEGEVTDAEATEAPAADAAVSPEPSAAPVTQAEVDAARQAILDSRKADIDSIYARLAKGETFQSLVAELGQDPGMTDETTLSEGYSVHRESIAWDPAFTAAAFSDKMQKIGDVSDPTVGTYGIHILYYLRDVASGLIMTDAIRQELSDFLMSVKESEAFNGAYTQWAAENTIVLNDEAIQAAIDSAQAAEPDAESSEIEGLQVLPEETVEASPTANP